MKERKVHGLESLKMLDEGEWVGRWASLPRLTATSLKSLLEELFRSCHWLRKNGKPMSEKSRTDYFNHVMRSYSDLEALGFFLKKPWNLEQRHIGALCAHWTDKNLSASTVQNRLMALSWFGAVIGRPGFIRGTHDYQASYGERTMKRHQATDRDRSPLACDVSADEVITRAMAIDETFGNMVKLQLCLGLRDKEVIRAKPLRDMFWKNGTGPADQHEGGNSPAPRARRKTQSTDELRSYWLLRAGRGSKGGRPRRIELWQGEWQAKAIQEVCDFLVKRGRDRGLTLAQSRDQSMGWSSLVTLIEQSKACNIAQLVVGNEVCNIADWPKHLRGDMNFYHRCAQRAGFTKAALGFTPHGLRHFFALRELEARGYRAEIAQGDSSITRDATLLTATELGFSDEEMASLMRYAVSKQLGHARESVTASYYGKRVVAAN